MKTVRNIILVIIFGVLVGFCLYIAPNYKKDDNEGKTNLVINYSNVTGKMKGKVILKDDGKIYLSKDDIENYYDKYIYYDENYNYIIATANGKTACFDINNKTLEIDNSKKECEIIKENDEFYIPISELQEVYNIKVNYVQYYDTVVIESLDKKLETASVKKDVSVKYKDTEFSKTLEKLTADTKVAIVPNENNIDYKGWTLIKTDNGKIGYVKNEDLSDRVTEREEQVEEKKTISLVWEYYSSVGKAPVNGDTVKYNGVNVVSPSFFYLEDGEVKENVNIEGVNYINWAKNNNYEVWAMVKSDNSGENGKDEFSEWINDYEKRKVIINQIVNYAKGYNLDGINIDFENIYKADKDALSRFIIELKPQLEQNDVTLSVDVTEPDGSDNWSLCFDRNVIGDVADYIIFMAYDQFGSTSKIAGSTASYDWVERNITKFINQEGVDASKIILGIPLYTRLWKGDASGTTNITVAMKNVDKYITSQEDVQWLESAQQNYIEYVKDNVTYKMWIEDETSINKKLELIEKYNLAGAAFWQKGFEDESIWDIVNEKLFK